MLNPYAASRAPSAIQTPFLAYCHLDQRLVQLLPIMDACM